MHLSMYGNFGAGPEYVKRVKMLREVVSNFQESGDRSKNSTFFLFAPKDSLDELFSKIIFKSSSEFLFW